MNSRLSHLGLMITLLLLATVGPWQRQSMAHSWPDLSEPLEIEATGANDVAVIVAIDDYAFLPDVTGAVRNANDWENFLRHRLGVPRVYTLVNRDATREAILRFANMAVEDARDGGRLWFIFIGHGAPIDRGRDGGLVGMDALQTVESLDSRSIGQSELLEILEGGPQESTLLIVDACFSGRAEDGTALAEGMQPVIPIHAAPAPATTAVVLSAARSDQYAGPLPGEARPAFTYLLLGAMRGWASGDNDAVTAEQAIHYTRQKLRGVHGRHQSPEFSGNGEIILTRGVRERDPISEELLRTELPTPHREPQELEESPDDEPIEAPTHRAPPPEFGEEPGPTGSSAAKVLMVSGAGLILGAGGTALYSRSLIAGLDPSQSSQAAGYATIDRANLLIGVSGGLLVTGTASLLTGAFLHRSARTSEASVSVAVGVNELRISTHW